MLTSTNLGQWKEYIMILLGCMDLDFAFRHYRLVPLTGDSTMDQKMLFEKWKWSDHMSLMIMKM